MKLLFIDNSAELQQKWIEPLRAEGWGALRARSPEDADRMLMFHGDSIEVVVVHESMVKWAESHDYAFVVLTKAWGDKEVLAHQNSKRSAFFYQKFDGRVQDLQAAIHSYRSGGPASGDKKEGTQWTATKTIALEDFTGVLTKPEHTRTNAGGESSIKLEAPSVLFGGESTNTGIPASKNDGLKISLEKTQPDAKAPASSSSVSISLDMGAGKDDKTVVRQAPQATEAVDKSKPEVMEVKIDLDAPTRVYQPEAKAQATQATQVHKEDANEATRISIEPPTASIEKKAADPTVVLESTKLELTSEKEISQQIDAMAEEQELVGDLSLNEAVGMSHAMGSIRSSSTPTQSGHASHPVSQTGIHTQIHQVMVNTPPPVVRVLEGDEALKNYLALREQDVAVLTGQVRSGQERIQQLELQLKVEKARATELQHTVQKQEQTLKNFNNEKQVEVEVLYRQVEDLNIQLQERSNRAHTIEAKLKITTDEVNKVKERVRVDIRRIRVREKELESQLEVLKKDSAALLQARDEKILELKRKLDLLEFNMELIQEQYNKERQSSEELRNRLKDAAKAMRQAGGLLEQ